MRAICWAAGVLVAVGLGHGCGGQTGQPNAAVALCEDACCGEGDPTTRFETGPSSTLLSHLRAVEGEYEVPLYWLPVDTQLPVAPTAVTPLSSSTLHVELEYVGTDTLTVPSCTDQPLLPVRVRLTSEDGSLDAEFLALAGAGSDSVVQLIPMSSDVALVTESPSAKSLGAAGAAGAGTAQTLVQVASADVTELPALGLDPVFDEVPSSGDCTTQTVFEFDQEFGAVGHVCLPESGLAVWPYACGGVAPGEPGGWLGLFDTGRLQSIRSFEGLVDVELHFDGAETCQTPSDGTLTEAELTFGVEGERQSSPVPVLVDPPAIGFGVEANTETPCFDYDSGEALSEFAKAALDCSFCDEPSDDPELEAVLNAGIVGGRACVDGSLVWADGTPQAFLEVMFTFDTEDGTELDRGYALDME